MGRESERRRLSAIAPRPLIRVLARSKSDKDAVENSLKHFVGSEAEVGSLKGARKPNDAEDQLKNHADFKGLVIVMLGLEDLGLFELSTKFPANFVFYLVPRSKVRNERPHRILRHYLKAKAMFRLNVRWDSENSMYTLLGRGEILEGWRVHPRYDVYMPTKGMVEKLASSYSIRPTLMLKKLAGHYSLYSGEKIVANMMLAEKGYQIKVERASHEEIHVADLNSHASLNKGLLELLEAASVNYLSSFDVDYVVVPWSGGKDSTVTLILSSKALGKKVVPVFVDTGLEFKETLEYVDNLACQLGISLLKLKAPIKEAIESGRELPTNKNRWCTHLKVKATQGYIRQLSKTGKVLMVVGDREAESSSRLNRPATIEHEDHVEAAPIKFWSAMHVQLYLALNKVPLNPMYDYGFFRVGCYICPALRSWEISLIMEDDRLKYIREDPLFKVFAKEREVPV